MSGVGDEMLMRLSKQERETTAESAASVMKINQVACQNKSKQFSIIPHKTKAQRTATVFVIVFAPNSD